MNKDKTREQIIQMSEEEAREYIYEYNINTEGFIRRYNQVNFDCGLSRAGIQLNPTNIGELVLDYE